MSILLLSWLCHGRLPFAPYLTVDHESASLLMNSAHFSPTPSITNPILITMTRTKTIEVLKPTTDDWGGNFEGDKVLIMFHDKSVMSDQCYLVSASGNDDYCLEWRTQSRKEAHKMFQAIKQMPVVTKQHLMSLGFVLE